MMYRGFTLAAAAILLATPALAEEIPQATAPAYNCDFQPSCEVAPGLYGKMWSPVNSKFTLSVGGFVKLDYAYNSTNLGANGALGTLQNGIPKDSSPAGHQDQSIFTARQSRLWFKATGPNFLGAKTSAIIETDFYGGGGTNESPTLRLRLANGSLEWARTQVVFGQAYDIFGPAISSTIDFGSGNKTGAPNNPRVPQIRLTQRVDLTPDNALRLIVGVQNPVQNVNAQTGNATDSWGSTPNVAGQAMLISKALGVGPGYFGLSMNSLTAGFFGLYGKQDMGGTVKSKVDSWGYGFYTFVPLLPSADGKSRAMTASFEGQAYMAANQSVNGATAASVVGPLDNRSPAKGYGYYGQIMFFPVQELGVTAGYGRRSAYDYGSYTGIANFEKYNSNLYANISYDLNAAVRVAVEYQHLKTKYGNVANGTGNLAGLSDVGSADVGRFAAFYFF